MNESLPTTLSEAPQTDGIFRVLLPGSDGKWSEHTVIPVARPFPPISEWAETAIHEIDGLPRNSAVRVELHDETGGLEMQIGFMPKSGRALFAGQIRRDVRESNTRLLMVTSVGTPTVVDGKTHCELKILKLRNLHDGVLTKPMVNTPPMDANRLAGTKFRPVTEAELAGVWELPPGDRDRVGLIRAVG